MAKTKSTYNKKRSMRRSTRKAGFSMPGFSSEPKSWDEWAKQGKSDAAKMLKAAEGSNQYSHVARSIHSQKEDLIAAGQLPASARTWTGGKRRRSKRSTKKAGNFSDLPGLGVAYLENKYDDAKNFFGRKAEGGKRRRSNKSTRKRAKKAGYIGYLPHTSGWERCEKQYRDFGVNDGDCILHKPTAASIKLVTGKGGGKRRRSNKSTRKRSRKH